MNKDVLVSFVDKVVKIDRGGPESRIGKVLAVEEDHMVVLTEDDGVIYYNPQHIKSLTNNAKQGFNFELEVPENFEYLQARNFQDVLNSLRHRWVQVNRGGPEKLEGVLEEVSDEYIVVVSGEEVVRLATYHLRNISYGLKVEKAKPNEEQNNQKNNNNNDKAANKNDNKQKQSNGKKEESKTENVTEPKTETE